MSIDMNTDGKDIDLPSYIVDKAHEVQDMYGADPFSGKYVAVMYDMNGPITGTDSKELPVDEEIQARITAAEYSPDTVLFALNSGYDIQTQEYIRDERLGRPDFGLVGGHGSTYAVNGTIYQTYEDADADDRIKIEQRLYENAAHDGMKLGMQGNKSNAVGAVIVEGEQRGEAYKHPLADAAVRTEDIWTSLQETESFHGEWFENCIRFESTPENADALSHVLKYDHPYAGVRFGRDEDKLLMWRDPHDADIPYTEVNRFMEEVVKDTSWRVNENPDWTFDYMNSDVDVNKDAGTAAAIEEAFGTRDENDFMVTMVGDNPSDIPRFENSMFFAQEGTEAEKYCKDEDIPHVTVQHAGDYTLIIQELLQKRN